MKLFVSLLGLVALALGGCAASAPAAQAGEAKPVYVVRHMQKAQGDDPPLSAEGAANAQRLAELLSAKGIVAIFATPTRRAMQTAEPLATKLGIAVTSYEAKDPDRLVEAVAAARGPVLVVGHSNTVPDLVDRLGGPPQPPLSDTDYGTVYVVEPDGDVTSFAVR
ncbi:MAG: SixA phosphatase family protein [Alphaproteobacteria bacterium]